MRPYSVVIAFLVMLMCIGCTPADITIKPPRSNNANLFSPTKNPPSKIRGTWTSEAYGWILDINEAGVKLYDVNSTNCTNATSLLESYETYFHTYTLEDNKLGLSGVYYPYTYYFEPLAELPLKCKTPPVITPSGVFDFFVETMKQHYAFFDERGANWDNIVAEHKPEISDTMSDDELWTVLRTMLKPINDGHITLREFEKRKYFPGRGKTMMSIVPLALSKGENPQAMFEAWYADYIVQIETKLLGKSAQQRANNRVIFGLIDDEVGYINIRSMGGYIKEIDWTTEGFNKELAILDSALDEAMVQFENAKGVIIDVSDNSGGFGMFSDLIASRFATKTLEGNYRFPASHPELIQREPAIKPSEKHRFTGPVIVVGSNLTVSAGESFMMSIRQSDNVRIAGEPTRGALSEVMTKTLPNGWELDLSNEPYLDEQKRLWEVSGIQPDIPMQVFNPDDIFEGHTDAINKLATRLTEEYDANAD